jgi:putative transcriptional regulator
MPSEIEKFQKDLLESVKQMKRGEAAQTARVTQPEAAEARANCAYHSKINLDEL